MPSTATRSHWQQTRASSSSAKPCSSTRMPTRSASTTRRAWPRSPERWRLNPEADTMREASTTAPHSATPDARYWDSARPVYELYRIRIKPGPTCAVDHATASGSFAEGLSSADTAPSQNSKTPSEMLTSKVSLSRSPYFHRPRSGENLNSPPREPAPLFRETLEMTPRGSLHRLHRREDRLPMLRTTTAVKVVKPAVTNTETVEFPHLTA
mmetsp:Transcript_85329/g.240028  ORF Transcript_85329/g.240028 Transcript_85329/m.240028 type:complete len:211 (-) Transcript_85329:164-796(-)